MDFTKGARLKKRLSRLQSIIIFSILLALVSLSNTGCTVEGSVKVVRVVDGDTLVVNVKGEEQKVRLIGVDTPESVKPNYPVEPYGLEAKNYTQKMLEGKNVRLTYDVQPKDKYGRGLVYLYLEDDTFFNELLVKEGYAKVMTVPPNVKYEKVFIEGQQFARENQKGLWGIENKDDFTQTTDDYTKLWVDQRGNGLIKGSKSKIYHLPGGEYYDKTTNVVQWFKTEEEAIEAGYRKSKQ